jgi:predicted phosphodiesterase
MNNSITIPVIVQGQAITSKNNPVRRQSSKPPHRRDHKVLIVGDSHARLCATKVKSEIKGSFDVQGIVKPGARAGVLVNTANSDITNLTKNNVIILCGGSNDVAKNDSKTAVRHIRNFIKSVIQILF